MPGIDKTRFINIGDNEDELLCGICLAVFVNPMVTKCCQTTYCSDCINRWLRDHNTCPNDRKYLNSRQLTQPPRLVINLLNRMKIRCDFLLNGCFEDVSYARYAYHIKDCRYNPDAICGDCGEKNGVRSDHNCVRLLLEKNRCLESSNKELGDKNARMEMENWKLKRNTDETIKDLTEKLRQSNAITNKVKSFCTKLNDEKQKLEEEKSALEMKITEMNEFRQKVSLYFSNIKNEVLNFERIDENNNNNNDDNKSDSSESVDIPGNVKQKFEFYVKNISELFCLEYVDGPQLLVNGLKWNIRAKYYKENETEYLGFYVVCNSVSLSLWSCNANVELSIVKQSERFGKYKLKFGHVFCYREFVWGYPKFMPLEEVLDPRNGYVNDDTIKLEVRLSTGH